MPTERNKMVRERAYALWVEAGRQEGQGEAHWLQAEREIDRDALAEGRAVTRPLAMAALARLAPSATS